MEAIKISAESLATFQHDKNVLPAPPAMLVEQPDGTFEAFSKRDIMRAGDEINRFSALFERNGYESFSYGYTGKLAKLCPEKFQAFVEAYEQLYEEQREIEHDML